MNDLQIRKNEIIKEQQQIALGQGEEVRKTIQNQLNEEYKKLQQFNQQIEFVQQQIKRKEKEKIKAEEFKKEIEELTKEIQLINSI